MTCQAEENNFNKQTLLLLVSITGPFAFSAICCIAETKPRSSVKVISTSSKRIKCLSCPRPQAIVLSLEAHLLVVATVAPRELSLFDIGITSIILLSESGVNLPSGRAEGNFAILLLCGST